MAGGPVQDALRGLQSLKVLPGAQQGRVVDQCVKQLPARADPLTACLNFSGWPICFTSLTEGSLAL